VGLRGCGVFEERSFLHLDKVMRGEYEGRQVGDDMNHPKPASGRERMRGLSIAAAALMTLVCTAPAQVVLHAGDEWIYTFPTVSAFPIIETLPFTFGPPQNIFYFAIDPASLATNSELRYEIVAGGLYEGSPAEGCYSVTAATGATLRASSPSAVSISLSGDVWISVFYPGGIRFRMLSGAATITNVTMDARIPHPGPGGARYDAHHRLSFSPAAGPVLKVTRSGLAQVRLNWPSNFPNYMIEMATNVPSPPCEWKRLTNTPAMNGGEWYLELDGLGATTFFRLRRR
jgi:hypothetical protein